MHLVRPGDTNCILEATSGVEPVLRAYLGGSCVARGESPGRPLSTRSWGGLHGPGQPRRRLANSGLALGAGGAAPAGAPEASAGLPQPARSRPRRDERDPLGAAHRDAMERAERDRHLPLKLRPPALSGVGAGRGLSRDLAPGTARLRR